MRAYIPNNRKGFTLIELLLVVAIIAIITAIAIPQFTRYRLRGYKAELDADARNVYNAAQAYLTDNPFQMVNTMDKLKSGGYQPSVQINWVSGNITLYNGIIEIKTNAAELPDNNAVIFHNGRIAFANAP